MIDNELKTAKEYSELADQAVIPWLTSTIRFEAKEGKKKARVNILASQEALVRAKFEPLGFAISHQRGESWEISWDVAPGTEIKE